jgi:hypothetical protein
MPVSFGQSFIKPVDSIHYISKLELDRNSIIKKTFCRVVRIVICLCIDIAPHCRANKEHKENNVLLRRSSVGWVYAKKKTPRGVTQIVLRYIHWSYTIIGCLNKKKTPCGVV